MTLMSVNSLEHHVRNFTLNPRHQQIDQCNEKEDQKKFDFPLVFDRRLGVHCH